MKPAMLPNFRRTLAIISVSGLVTTLGLTFSLTAHADTQIDPTEGPAAGGNQITLDAPSYGFTEVSAGSRTAVALNEDGQAFTWGSNSEGQLGNPEVTATLSGVPVPVVMPEGVTFTSVSSGRAHIAALDEDGNLYTWGDGGKGATGLGTEFDTYVPTLVVGSNENPVPKFVQVSAAEDYTVALTASGEAWAWGENDAGQLGIGADKVSPTIYQYYPVPTEMPAGISYKVVLGGGNNSFALDTSGQVWTWGTGRYGSLGQGGQGWQASYTPGKVIIPGNVEVKQIAGGYLNGAAIDVNDNVWTWGQGSYGELGNGHNNNQAAPVAVVLPPNVIFDQIAIGWSHMAGKTDEGKLYLWGYARIGDGSASAIYNTPTAVATPEGLTFPQISAGTGYSTYLADDGQIYAIGSNTSGTLGNGSTDPSDVFVLSANFLTRQVTVDGEQVTPISDSGSQVSFTMPAGTPGNSTVSLVTILSGGATPSDPLYTISDDATYTFIGDLDGTVSLAGTAVIGGSISVSPASMPEGTTYTYQWFSSDNADGSGAVPIAGQTGNTLVLPASLLDKYVGVHVVASHKFYNGQEFDPDFVGPVVWPQMTDPGTASLGGTAVAMNELTVTTADWPVDTDFTYEWYLADDAAGTNQVLIPGAEGATYTIPASAEGKYIAAKVTGHDGLSVSAEVPTDFIGAITLPDLPLGNVTITGVVDAGQTLTVETTGWPVGTTFAYQWLVADSLGGTGVPIEGATAETFVPDTSYENKFISVHLVATLSGYNDGQITSDQVGPIDLPDVTAGTATISGSAVVGSQLNANADGWGPDGLEYTYQWFVSPTSDGTGKSPISGATDQYFRPTDNELGQYVWVEITGSVAGHDPVSVMSDGVGPVVLPTLDTGNIAILNPAIVGNDVLAAATLWPLDSTLAYQWYVADDAAGTGAVEIPGATETVLNVPPSAAGKFLSVKVTATETGYLPSSAQTEFIPVAFGEFSGTVSIGGKTEPGQQVEAVTDGFPPGTTFTYQWKLSDNADGSGATDIVGATGSTLIVPDEAIGKYLVLVVEAEADGYTPASYTKVSAQKVAKPVAVVERIGGATRYDTSADMLSKNMSEGDVVFVATGALFPDALSAGPAAAINDAQVVLSQPGQVPAKVLSVLKQKKPSKVYLIGGTSALSANVEKQLRGVVSAPADVIRVGGENRYDTSAKVYQRFFGQRTVESAYVATGTNFADAITASSMAGAVSAPVLLVNGRSAQNLLPTMLTQLKMQNVDEVVVVGGSQAVSKTIQNNLAKTFTVQRVSGDDRYQTSVALNQHLNDLSPTVPVEQIYLATGHDFADALTAAPAAANLESRMVLSNGKCIPSPVVSQWIKGATSQVSRVTLVGGEKALSPSVFALTQCK